MLTIILFVTTITLLSWGIFLHYQNKPNNKQLKTIPYSCKVLNFNDKWCKVELTHKKKTINHIIFKTTQPKLYLKLTNNPSAQSIMFGNTISIWPNN